VSIETVSVLLEYSPQATKFKDKRGRTPFYWACDGYVVKPLKEMLFLLEKWPEAIKERDNCDKCGFDTERDGNVKKLLTYAYKLFDYAPIDDDLSK